MKIAISYPPLDDPKGIPLLAQNRQFQWFSKPTYIYPMVEAYAATLLNNAGYDIVWDDGIAEEKTYNNWFKDIVEKKPDIIAIETKTPVVKKHWKIINNLKEDLPETSVVLMGDHVTVLPLESFENSNVDMVITGGDYDFSLLSIARWKENKGSLESGIYYKQDSRIKNTGKFRLDHDLDSLLYIDRNLTKWWLYAYKNGNFKRTPGTYTMAGRDCWWRNYGGCTFCSWPTLYPNFRSRAPELLVDEIGVLIERYGVKEVFDDTGTFPTGQWLRKFCELMIERGYNKKISMGCNMRFEVLSRNDYQLMKKAGFRMVLFGVESGSQRILDEINKGLTVNGIIDSCRLAKESGLIVHITIMFGHLNSSKKEEFQTYQLAKKLMDEGCADTLQSTLVVPYPGTKLYEKALEKGLLRFSPGEWEHWDMSEPVLKNDHISSDEVKRLCDETYRLFWSPKYVLRRLLSIRSFDDIKFSFRGVRKIIGHIKDFK